MFSFLGRRVSFKTVPRPFSHPSNGIPRSVKAVPRPVSHTPNGIPRSVNSSQSNVDVEFWLDRLERSSEKQLKYLESVSDKREEEFEKQRKEWHEERYKYLDHIQGFGIEREAPKVS